MRKVFKVSAFLLSAMTSSAGPAFAAISYDGSWNVVVICPDSGDVQGYTWRFPAQVRAGEFSGKFVNPRDPQNYGVLSGAISSTGDALLTMNGIAGPPVYNIHHAPKHSNIHYTATVHFDARNGSGNRNGEKVCSLTFSKN
jgi:hypothetical protein